MTKQLHELDKTIDLKGIEVTPDQENYLSYTLNHYLIIKEDKLWLSDRMSLPNLSSLLYTKELLAESIELVQDDDAQEAFAKLKAKEEAAKKKAAAERKRKADAKKKADEKKEAEVKTADEK